MFIKVDFPDPFGHNKPYIEPLGILILKLFKASIFECLFVL
jgi:hypothetical protein